MAAYRRACEFQWLLKVAGRVLGISGAHIPVPGLMPVLR